MLGDHWSKGSINYFRKSPVTQRGFKKKLKILKVIIISAKQCLDGYAGNCLELRGKQNQSMLVMSSRAKNILTEHQILEIEKYSKIVEFKIDLIEKIGGGSARCMIAEIFNKNIYW